MTAGQYQATFSVLPLRPPEQFSSRLSKRREWSISSRQSGREAADKSDNPAAEAGAIERLISGEVPAAVLTLASREAAEWFPDIADFRTFRVPLAQKARL